MADPRKRQTALAGAGRAPVDRQQQGDTPEPGGYTKMPGIRWVPLYPQKSERAKSTALAQARRGFKHGLIGAAIVLVATATLAYFYRDASVIGTLIGVGGAVAAGVFMVVAGMGMLAGEALQAVEVEIHEPSRELLLPDDGGLKLFRGWAEPINAARQGLQGLTAARAAIFAGALLLAIAAIGGGISTAGSDGAGDDSAPSTTAPTTSTSSAPTSAP